MALTFPLVLTIILFLGPLAMLAATDRLKWFFQSAYWNESLTDWVWWRNHVVAPVTEEFAFRLITFFFNLEKINHRHRN